MRFTSIPKLNSVRLGTTNKFYSALPMPGEYAETITLGEYYPWALDRTGDGGLGLLWWRKALAFDVLASLTITDTDPGGFGSLTVAGGNTAVRFGTVYGDERDTEFENSGGETYWQTVITVPNGTITVTISLYGPNTSPNGALASAGSTQFFVNETELAPQFWVNCEVDPTAGPDGYIRSYASAASSVAGTGTIDGESFDLQIPPSAPNGAFLYIFSAPSLVITTASEYGWT